MHQNIFSIGKWLKHHHHVPSPNIELLLEAIYSLYVYCVCIPQFLYENNRAKSKYWTFQSLNWGHNFRDVVVAVVVVDVRTMVRCWSRMYRCIGVEESVSWVQRVKSGHCRWTVSGRGGQKWPEPKSKTGNPRFKMSTLAHTAPCKSQLIVTSLWRLCLFCDWSMARDLYAMSNLQVCKSAQQIVKTL